MAKQTKVAAIPTKHVVVPRTLKAAQKLGHKPANIKFDDLPDELKSNFIMFADTGARPGSCCGVGSSIEPGYVLVCYRGEKGERHWYHVPKGALMHQV